MRRRLRAVAFIASGLSLISLSGAAAATPRVPVSWGVYAGGTAPQALPRVRALGAAAGKPPGIVMWYPNWGGPYSDVRYARAGVDAVLAAGAVPMLSWMTRNPSDPRDVATYSDAAIAAGGRDAYIAAYARGLAGARGLVYLRLDHEMNGDWYPWSSGPANTATSFIRMWRHVHDVFVREGATNVRWVWSPNVTCGGCTDMAKLYPGDAYVDWLALDGYNFGTHDGHQWQSFDQVFRASYFEILRIAKKPLMLAELGTVERGSLAGQTKAAWLTDALSTIRIRYPAVRAFVWFNQNNGPGEDFRLTSSATDLQAFRRGLAAPTFVSGPPR